MSARPGLGLQIQPRLGLSVLEGAREKARSWLRETRSKLRVGFQAARKGARGRGGGECGIYKIITIIDDDNNNNNEKMGANINNKR